MILSATARRLQLHASLCLAIHRIKWNKRHTAASHFLQAGVDLVTIGRWLGHANVSPTSIYAEVDLESKRQAVRKAKPLLNAVRGSAGWRTSSNTLRWLESL